MQLLGIVAALAEDRATLDDAGFARAVNVGIGDVVAGTVIDAGEAGRDAARRALELLAMCLRVTWGGAYDVLPERP